jgi:hypothetical protein
MTKGFDEAVPDRGTAVDGDVRGDAEFGGARLDGRALSASTPPVSANTVCTFHPRSCR